MRTRLTILTIKLLLATLLVWWLVPHVPLAQRLMVIGLLVLLPGLSK